MNVDASVAGGLDRGSTPLESIGGIKGSQELSRFPVLSGFGFLNIKRNQEKSSKSTEKGTEKINVF